MQSGGVRFMVTAAFSFSLMSLFVRLVGERLPSFEIVFVRACVSLVLTVAHLRHAGLTNWLGTRRKLLVMRGLVGFGALSCFFYSVINLPLAEATVIQFTSPIFTAVLASIVLGERATGRVWGAIALGICGVLLITRPAALFAGRSSELPVAIVLVGLSGAGLTSVAYILVRHLAPHEHELVVVFYFPLVVIPASLVSAGPSWVWPEGREWLLLLAVGVGAQIGQIFLTRGMRHLGAASASVVLYLQIVFATLWGILALGERPDLWTVAGSLLILGGTVVASRRPRLPD